MSKSKLTYLDFAILGLLHQQPNTGYGIRKIFETTALGNYSSSPGTIYPAINKLRKLNLVVQKSDTQAKKKKLFFVSSEGTQQLIAWLSMPVENEDIRKISNILILRFAYMDDLVNHGVKIRFLKSMISMMTTYLNGLKEYHATENENLKLHGRLALEHGIILFKSQLKWAKYALKEISNLN